MTSRIGNLLRLDELDRLKRLWIQSLFMVFVSDFLISEAKLEKFIQFHFTNVPKSSRTIWLGMDMYRSILMNLKVFPIFISYALNTTPEIPKNRIETIFGATQWSKIEVENSELWHLFLVLNECDMMILNISDWRTLKMIPIKN